MNSDELLDQLTRADSGGVEALVAAARTGARRRRLLHDAGAAALILLCLIGGLLMVRPRPGFAPAPAVANASPPPAPLSGDELLDSFGDQPVALVTYPDGSQKLLAVVRP